MRTVVIAGLEQATYQPHALHREAAAWPETNCYVDLWIEVLHALHLDPAAMLAFSFRADFEGDQWTFLKPSHDDLYTLYGIDVQELDIWDMLGKQLCEQVARGRLPIVEADSFYLPDTHGISYRIEHTKTTIGVNAIDMVRQRLGYFHNGGYYHLEGEDFQSALRLTAAASEACLPPYVEFARLDACSVLPSERLREVSLETARRHLRRRPQQNPVTAFRKRFARDMEVLLCGPVDYYHRYAFSNIRQLGIAFQTAAAYVRWLEAQGPLGLDDAAAAFDALSDMAKTLLFKMARAVNAKRPFSYEAAMDTLEANWQIAFDTLAFKLGAQ